ncbi:MAG: HD domain-containing protein [Candidatus Magasanikbacteria bacterium]|nr:HD domain-containing protein [Candidatus Magasanikbacteria bacterium]
MLDLNSTAPILKMPDLSASEQEVVAHVQQRIEMLFTEFPAPSHGQGHATRVANNAYRISTGDGAHPFLPVLCGLLHDIGRAREFNGKNPEKKRHHALSYEMLQEWFQEDTVLAGSLNTDQKLELLYGLKYHYNDFADAHYSAITLRDADKLDAFGQIGLARGLYFCQETGMSMTTNIRYLYQFAYWLRSKSARAIFDDEKLIEPITAYYKEELEKQITPVTLLP